MGLGFGNITEQDLEDFKNQEEELKRTNEIIKSIKRNQKWFRENQTVKVLKKSNVIITAEDTKTKMLRTFFTLDFARTFKRIKNTAKD